MTLPKLVSKDHYSEAEAARILGVSIARLHQLLDHHVFNVGSRRPPDIEFTSSDIVLLSYWNKESSGSGLEPSQKVIPIDNYK
jgi:hypothetical protein